MMKAMSKLQRTLALAALALLVVAAPAGTAANGKCEALPRSALKTRTCNPQADCQRAIPRELSGPARAARERECARLPVSGVCYGPETYDPQADCRDTKRR
jgi:hypothetical protein